MGIMKRILFVIVILFIYSCHSSDVNNTHVNAPNTDTINRDTLQKSSASIVYGDLRFGMAKKEATKLINSGFTKIGTCLYRLLPEFDSNDKLYYLSIVSASTTADNIETTIEDEMENLYSVIKSKYGKESHNFGDIDFFALKPGVQVYKYGWDIFSKRIKIGKAQDSYGGKYFAFMNIYDENMYKVVLDSINKTDENQQKKDSEKF